MPKTKEKPLLASQIQEALKNRQNVEIRGKSVAVRKLLDELITISHGKALIPAAHEEDHTISIQSNVSFPPSDKITTEGVMRQVLQVYGWPVPSHVGYTQFYFGKLLKELLHDRVVPVFLFEHPEVMKMKAFSILQILSEYTMGRTPVGIPSIICITERGRPVASLTASSLIIELEDQLTKSDIVGLIEESFPGLSKIFEASVIKELEKLPSLPAIKTAIKDLVRYMNKLGLDTIGEELLNHWRQGRKQRRKYAPAEA